VEDKTLIRPGVLEAERLVNMSKHQYRLEPNVSFTPDQKWIVFRSNMFGATYVFGVEVAKANSATSADRPKARSSSSRSFPPPP
jgi:oligogalacturonide lyase